MKRITKFACVLIFFEITLFMKAKLRPFLGNNLTIYKKHGGGVELCPETQICLNLYF